MGTDRFGQRARRGLGALVLGCGSGIGVAILLAPGADAGTLVSIGKVAPAPVTVNPGDTVTFLNAVPKTTVTVPGPLPATATVLTDETLGGACGGRTLAPGTSVGETFSQSTTCPVTYAYSVQGATLAAVQALLPPLPSPTSIVVTVVPAAQSVAGSLPPPPAPLPSPGSIVPAPAPAPAPVPGTGGGTSSGGGTPSGGTGGTSGGTTVVGGSSGGTASAPGAATGAAAGVPSGTSGASGSAQPAQVDRSAASSFDPARFSSSGSAAPVAGHAGSAMPVLASLAGSARPSPLPDSGPGGAATAADTNPSAPALPLAALAAVVTLSAVFAGLVRTHLAARAQAPRGAHAAR